MGYIYKIQNKISDKCYIGETKQHYEKRWKEHIRSINTNRGCPALKDAIKKYGLENFKFEIIIICFDDDRFEIEKEYIKKYNSLVPNGYNIIPGGEGGGFNGKKHTCESIKKIKESQKKFRELNPAHYELYRERHQSIMKTINISSYMKKSEIWKKAVEDGRVGNKDLKLSDKTKQQISESITKYYLENNGCNIENHRKSMAKAVGKKIAQYINDKLMKEYMSIREAGRISGVKYSTIQKALSGNKVGGGFIWKYI